MLAAPAGASTASSGPREPRLPETRSAPRLKAEQLGNGVPAASAAGARSEAQLLAVENAPGLQEIEHRLGGLVDIQLGRIEEQLGSERLLVGSGDAGELGDLTGARLTTSFTRIGGVAHDVEDDWLARLREFTDAFPGRVDEFESLLKRKG